MFRSALLPFVGLLVLISSGAPAQEPPGKASPMQVEDAWARPSVQAGGNGAIYLVIRNTGQEPDRLTKAETPVADMASLHAVTMHGDVVRMREAPAVPIPAGGQVLFKPGGWHIMLMGLKTPLQKGAKFPLTLTFAKAGPIEAQVMVRNNAPGSFWGEEGKRRRSSP